MLVSNDLLDDTQRNNDQQQEIEKMMLSRLWQNLNQICVFVLWLFQDRTKINKSMGWKIAHLVKAGIWDQDDVGCGPIFLMNTTMGVNITCEMLMNSPDVPLLSMQQISNLWIFATPHTCAHSRRPRSSLQSTNSQWNDRLYLIFRIEITRSQQSGERKILQIETKWNI
jgi:hypothetical protein